MFSKRFTVSFCKGKDERLGATVENLDQEIDIYREAIVHHLLHCLEWNMTHCRLFLCPVRTSFVWTMGKSEAAGSMIIWSSCQSSDISIMYCSFAYYTTKPWPSSWSASCNNVYVEYHLARLEIHYWKGILPVRIQNVHKFYLEELRKDNQGQKSPDKIYSWICHTLKAAWLIEITRSNLWFRSFCGGRIYSPCNKDPGPLGLGKLSGVVAVYEKLFDTSVVEDNQGCFSVAKFFSVIVWSDPIDVFSYIIVHCMKKGSNRIPLISAKVMQNIHWPKHCPRLHFNYKTNIRMKVLTLQVQGACWWPTDYYYYMANMFQGCFEKASSWT